MFAWLLRKLPVHDEKCNCLFISVIQGGVLPSSGWFVFCGIFFGMVIEDSSRIILLFQWFQKDLWLKHKAWYILPATPYHFSWQLSQCLGVRLSFSLCLLGKPLKMIVVKIGLWLIYTFHSTRLRLAPPPTKVGKVWNTCSVCFF